MCRNAQTIKRFNLKIYETTRKFMDNTLLTRLAKYGKFTIEATALKLESVWHSQYRIFSHKSEHKPALRGALSTDSYICGEVAVVSVKPAPS